MQDNGEIVELKDGLWLERQKYAGSIVAKAHKLIFSMIKGKASGLTLNSLGMAAEDVIRSNKCTPTFLNYKGFPSPICASVNKEIVHGFSNRDIELKNGDVLKIDIGATFEGAIGDCAVTYLVGKPKSDKVIAMLLSCQNALHDAIKIVEPGRRIGEIGKAIWERSKNDNFGVITLFGGHGINYDTLHASPFVPNKSKSDEGIVMQPGLSIAIEPMFVLGKNTNTKTLADNWTVITRDIGCHFEHSVTLDEDGKRHIITEHGIDVKNFC